MRNGFHRRVPGRFPFLKYWLPVAAWMILIFIGSTDVLSAPHTSRVIGPILQWLFPGISGETVRHVQLAVRKCGHVSEYAVLALLVWRARVLPHRVPGQPWRWREAGWAIAVAALYAATDEFHQSFVPSREGSVRDVLLDTVGATLGMICLWRLGRWRKLW